ncbi:MAG TPA: hypothetical protein V6D12_15040 [Candidatus Obscuribacterales bacterium]
MRLLNFWWRTFTISSQLNPPRFIELVMLLLAMPLLIIWGSTDRWPCLVLSLSYAIGASTSILVRESLVPSHQARLTKLTAVLLLIISIISLYSFTDIHGYLK